MAEGKYFYIESRLCGLVLDISGSNDSPGAAVLIWDKKSVEQAANQLWYQDFITGTIRSKLNDFCLDINDQDVVTNPYNAGDITQQWDVHGNIVRCRDGRYLDIDGGNTDAGTKVLAWEEHGAENQEWRVDYAAPRYFYIKSEMNGKVLDIEGGDADAGSRVLMWSQHGEPSDNQLWYEGRDGSIRSKLNDLCLDTSDGGKLKTGVPGSDQDKQSWHFHQDKIVNKFNQDEVLDISGECGDDGAEVCAYDYHGGSNQRWNFEMI